MEGGDEDRNGIGYRARIGYPVRLFSGAWPGKGKEGCSADERVPLQLGVLGVGADTYQPGKTSRPAQIQAPNRFLKQSQRAGPARAVMDGRTKTFSTGASLGGRSRPPVASRVRSTNGT